MNLGNIRGVLVAMGVVPLILVALGLFTKHKYSKALLIIGGGWAIASVLFAVREVSATVTAGDPTLSYPSRGAAVDNDGASL